MRDDGQRSRRLRSLALAGIGRSLTVGIIIGQHTVGTCLRSVQRSCSRGLTAVVGSLVTSLIESRDVQPLYTVVREPRR